jgi:hypothetical protein
MNYRTEDGSIVTVQELRQSYRDLVNARDVNVMVSATEAETFADYIANATDKNGTLTPIAYRIRRITKAMTLQSVRAVWSEAEALTLSLNNSKTSATGKTANWSILPFMTCNPRVPCFLKCYAGKMLRGLHGKALRVSWTRNTEATKREDFSEAMIDAIRESGVEYVRIHVSGDFYDASYFSEWVKIAEALPGVRFLAFTKRDDIPDIMDALLHPEYLPENFTLVFSIWTDTNARQYPTAISGLISNRPADSVHCLDDCEVCEYKCWNLRGSARVFFPFH